ncbi:unnamed protein product, partial [Cyprideis torosa]
MEEDRIQRDFPLHFVVWKDRPEQLKEDLKGGADLEALDPRGRTPLLLAARLQRKECLKVLLDHHANVHAEGKDGWNVVQEATASGDRELLANVLTSRAHQRHSCRSSGIPSLLRKLADVPDFYVEMKWEFASWVPLVSRVCPSDTYKIYKKGSSVRIDTTLLGFEGHSWIRGNRTFIFSAKESLKSIPDAEALLTGETVDELDPSNISKTQEHFLELAEGRLKQPLVLNYVDTDKISFERHRSGIWGWRSDRTEEVSGRQCKVFTASNVTFMTKTRMEHLSRQEKERAKDTLLNENQLGTAGGGLAGLMGNFFDVKDEEPEKDEVTISEYFDASVDLSGKTLGRPREVSTRSQKFKATLWLCEDYPLTMEEQLIPIVDLMAISSQHFAKLKDFIQLQLPSGFPVKIGEDASAVNFTLRTYDEDEFLQFAIQESLLEQGSGSELVNVWEVLGTAVPGDEDRMM